MARRLRRQLYLLRRQEIGEEGKHLGLAEELCREGRRRRQVHLHILPLRRLLLLHGRHMCFHHLPVLPSDRLQHQLPPPCLILDDVFLGLLKDPREGGGATGVVMVRHGPVGGGPPA